MWIASKHGFFSIVRKSDGYHVRARIRQDLETLCREAGLDTEIHDWPTADYRWRVILPDPKALAPVYLAMMASVDYPNFKSEISATPSQRSKLGAYHQLWGSLESLQQRA